MLYVLKAIYAFILPPGCFVIALAVAGFIFISGKRRGAGITFFAAAALLYLASISAVSDVALRSLEGRYPFPASVAGADSVVVLTGGSISDTPNAFGEGNLGGASLGRFVEAGLLASRTGLPVIISGGQVYESSGNEGMLAVRLLAELGLAADSMLLEDRSRNTKENAANSAALLRERALSKPLLVTSAFHIPRAMKFFRAQGIEPIPYPVDYRLNPKRNSIRGAQPFAPSADALLSLAIAMKEYLGMLQ